MVTGGAGYMGSVLVGALLARDAEVLVVDELRLGGESPLYFFPFRGSRLVPGSICDDPILAQALHEAGAVVRLAALVGFSACDQEGRETTWRVGVESPHAIKAMAAEARRLLETGQLDAFGELPDTAWKHKQRLAGGITNLLMDECYAAGRTAWTLGGKIAGAGGGVLMLYCPVGTHASVTAALKAKGLPRMDFHFDFTGARVLLDAARRLNQMAAGAAVAV